MRINKINGLRYTGRARPALVASMVLCALAGGCGGGGGGGSSISTTDFAAWSAVQENSRVRVRGMSQSASGTYTLVGMDGIVVNSVTAGGVDDSVSEMELTFGDDRVLRGVTLVSPVGTLSWTNGRSGSSVGCDDGLCVAGNATSSALFLDPYAVGWNYQTFGVWATSGMTSGPFTTGVMSIGAPTPGTALPVAGTALYTGGALGYYTDASGELHGMVADLTATADFGARNIALSTSNTTIVSTVTGNASYPSTFDFSGTLAYAPGVNRFSGPVATGGGPAMTGTAEGRFYGPVAQEIGGVFVLQAPSGLQSMLGSFGGKQ